jgi:hypothetical protein
LAGALTAMKVINYWWGLIKSFAAIAAVLDQSRTGWFSCVCSMLSTATPLCQFNNMMLHLKHEIALGGF